MFTIPFEEIVTIPSIGSITRLLGFAVIAVGLAALARGPQVVLRRPMLFHAVALAFVVWNLATFFWSYEPSATVRQFVVYGQLFAFIWLMGEHARTHVRLAVLMQAFVLGNYVTFGLTVVAVFVQGNAFRDLGRFNANEVAIVAALAIPMAMALLAVPTAGWRRWVNAAYPIVAMMLIVLAASRGGFIVGLVALASVPFAFARANAAVRVGAFALLAGVVAVGFEVVPTAFPELQTNLERLAGTGEE
ncbi:MAG: hypothetical protein P1P87_12565, partial [Trueperaceae bacterium]|nr:hypothetical protein [Trueperaceae bacterium]